MPKKTIYYINISLLASDHSLKQSASQMWCLAGLLPLMIGTLIPEENEHWKNFLTIMMDYIFSPTTSASIACCLYSSVN
jgi:hypothetical protein